MGGMFLQDSRGHSSAHDGDGSQEEQESTPGDSPESQRGWRLTSCLPLDMGLWL